MSLGASESEIAELLRINLPDISALTAQITADKAANIASTPTEQLFAQYFIAQGAALRGLRDVARSAPNPRDQVAAWKGYAQVWSDLIKIGRELGVILPVIKQDTEQAMMKLSDEEFVTQIRQTLDLVAPLVDDSRNLTDIDMGPMHYDPNDLPVTGAD